MLYEDENDFFVGSVKSKFFDILFNANRDLVEAKLMEIMERYCAMGIALEKEIGEENLLNVIHTTLIEDADAIFERTNDLLMASTGEILTQNE